jgi:hypothetical protein
MSDKANHLAEKLMAEGDKTLIFFRGLPEDAWAKQVFEDGAQWDVRGVFEHLVLSEVSLLKLFAGIVRGGPGASEGFDVDRFNHEHTGQLEAHARGQLFEHYAATRNQTVSFTRARDDDQLAMRGRHPAMGDSPVEDMLKMIYLHHTMHMRDVKKAITPSPPPAPKGEQ